MVVLLGELDMGTAPYVRMQVQSGLAQQPERLIVDLSNVTFIGPAGLGVLVYAQQEAERMAAQLTLIGVQGNRVVRRALAVSGLSTMFDIEKAALRQPSC